MSEKYAMTYQFRLLWRGRDEIFMRNVLHNCHWVPPGASMTSVCQCQLTDFGWRAEYIEQASHPSIMPKYAGSKAAYELAKIYCESKCCGFLTQ